MDKPVLRRERFAKLFANLSNSWLKKVSSFRKDVKENEDIILSLKLDLHRLTSLFYVSLGLRLRLPWLIRMGLCYMVNF